MVKEALYPVYLVFSLAIKLYACCCMRQIRACGAPGLISQPTHVPSR